MAVAHVQRVNVPDGEEILAVIVQDHAALVARRDGTDQGLRPRAARRLAGDAVALRRGDRDGELDGFRGHARPGVLRGR